MIYSQAKNKSNHPLIRRPVFAIEKENVVVTPLQPLEVAVIGAGVIGIQVALGLANRNIRVTLYEQAPEVKELSAGFRFPDNIVECTRYLDPRLTDAVIKTGIRSEGTHRWVDGMTKSDLRLMHDEDIPGISPHHGAGAGMGVEDAVMLATLIERADCIIRSGGLDDSTLKCVAEALGIYDSVRCDRAQWLVASSRMQGQIVKAFIQKLEGALKNSRHTPALG